MEQTAKINNIFGIISIISVISFLCGCLSCGGCWYDDVGYDSVIILSYNREYNIHNQTKLFEFQQELNLSGIPTDHYFEDYLTTILYDDESKAENHLGGGIYFNYTKWISNIEIEYYNEMFGTDLLSLQNSTNSCVVISTCYLSNDYVRSSENITEKSEKYKVKLEYYNEIIISLLIKHWNMVEIASYYHYRSGLICA